ncbi:hypothetical protein PV779_34945 [Streptomyces sp. ID01-9D]|nr:hypothetical protein [Streptomyces sp. ID01-9D]
MSDQWRQPKQPVGDRGTHQKRGYPARPGLRTLPAAGRAGPGATAAHDEALDRETPAERSLS